MWGWYIYPIRSKTCLPLVQLKMVLHFLKIEIIILLLSFFYCPSYSQLPACNDSFPKSLLPNNSFEEYPGCQPGNEEGALLAGTDQYQLPDGKQFGEVVMLNIITIVAG